MRFFSEVEALFSADVVGDAEETVPMMGRGARTFFVRMVYPSAMR